MSSMFDDMMMGARAASALFKGAQKVGKLAMDGIQKVNESEKFQNMKTEWQDKVNNSETLNKLKTEVRQQVSRVTNTKPAAERKTCTRCGASIESDSRFCSSCGAEQEAVPAQETAAQQPDASLPEEPEVYEAKPTVLENDTEEIPEMFDFDPSDPSAPTARQPQKRERIPVRQVGKHPEAFLGSFHYDNPGYNIDLVVYQDRDAIRFTFIDNVSGRQKNERFTDWFTGGRGLTCHADECSYNFEFRDDGSLNMDTQGVYPGISGRYICLD